ncbi:flagellar hook-length control protein FliK [Nautilia sp.]
MSLIESLLLSLDVKETPTAKKNSSKSGDFLSEIINEFKNEPDKLKEIFKSFKIDEKSVKNLKTELEKHPETEKLPTEPAPTKQKKSKEVKHFSFVKNIQEFISETVPEHKNEEKTLEDFFENIKNGKIEIPPPREQKILEITKKIIVSSKNMQNIKNSDLKDIKNTTTLKGLITEAEKKQLNLSKIIIKHEKKTKTYKQQETDTGIKIKPPKPKVTLNEKHFFTKQPVNKKNETAGEIISTLLQGRKENKTEKEKEKTAPKTGTKHNVEHKNPQFVASNITQLKITVKKAKQSIQKFATDLKNAIENYKPPLSKLSMELHPKELGKVEVTIIHRGENLQIQINSNSTALNIFHTQQQELRQNLINMGFADVNMSFNSNQQKGNREYQQNQKFSNSKEEPEELIIEIPYHYA